MNKKLIVATLVATSAISLPASAQCLKSFGGISANYLAWTAGTKDRSPAKKDYGYIKVDGGSQFNWGSLFGFIEFNNPTKKSEKFGTTAKGLINVNTGINNLSYYGQIFNATKKGFTLEKNIIGLSYNIHGDGWHITPYIGLDQAILNKHGKSFSGLNGGAFGWVAAYNFMAFGEHFQIANWNDAEFSRKQAYLKLSGEGDHVATNGALVFWWNITPHLGTSVRWRYAYAKLGVPGNQNGFMYTIKYNF